MTILEIQNTSAPRVLIKYYRHGNIKHWQSNLTIRVRVVHGKIPHRLRGKIPYLSRNPYENITLIDCNNY